MFTPRELALERGWPGRIEGDRVIQLAAQTLQSFFTGGGEAREHAEYALADVDLRPPVLYPPAVRPTPPPPRRSSTRPRCATSWRSRSMSRTRGGCAEARCPRSGTRFRSS